MPSIGDSFRLDPEGGHLWVIITKISAEGNFVMVNLTSLGEHVEDTSCILDQGDHSFIRHRTVVSYKDAREWYCAGDDGYDECLASRRIHPSDPVSDDVLRRIQNGALKSKFTKRKFYSVIQSSLIAVP